MKFVLVPRTPSMSTVQTKWGCISYTHHALPDFGLALPTTIVPQ